MDAGEGQSDEPGTYFDDDGRRRALDDHTRDLAAPVEEDLVRTRQGRRETQKSQDGSAHGTLLLSTMNPGAGRVNGKA
jgi:hypothetical protein